MKPLLLIMTLAFILAAAVLLGRDQRQKKAEAIFAGGCFWCIEAAFEHVNGVLSAISGYTGGEAPNPSYEEVSSGKTGHMEAVRVVYDPTKVSYDALLTIFWRQIDPTDAGGQFADRGPQYRTAIFYKDDVERRLATASKKRLEMSGTFKKPIVTAILPAGTFFEAEAHHQDFFKTNPVHYQSYNKGSGREDFIHKKRGSAPKNTRTGIFEKPDPKRLRRQLSPLQFQVTQEKGTELPFQNAYWNNKAEGIYVDVVSGDPLFSSNDKFDSGTGWPSFTKPIAQETIVLSSDLGHGIKRTEVRSRAGDSHLGHLFDDGPSPTGQRYCINSASLRFVPKDELEENGLEEYEYLFEE